MSSLDVVLPSQSKWSDSLTHSIPTFTDYPKRFLSTEEKEFGLWLQSFRIHDHFQLISASALASKVKELWYWLLDGVSVSTLAKHLVRLTASSSRQNKSYLNREYRLKNGRTFGHWLFRKGLVRGYSLPKRGARRIVEYGYPIERYPLVMKNFVSPFPPHDFFASRCTLALQSGRLVMHEVSHIFYCIDVVKGHPKIPCTMTYWTTWTGYLISYLYEYVTFWGEGRQVDGWNTECCCQTHFNDNWGNYYRVTS